MNYNERLKYGIDQGNFLMKEIDTVCLQKRIRKKYEYQWIPINEDKFRKKATQIHFIRIIRPR